MFEYIFDVDVRIGYIQYNNNATVTIQLTDATRQHNHRATLNFIRDMPCKQFNKSNDVHNLNQALSKTLTMYQTESRSYFWREVVIVNLCQPKNATNTCNKWNSIYAENNINTYVVNIGRNVSSNALACMDKTGTPISFPDWGSNRSEWSSRLKTLQNRLCVAVTTTPTAVPTSVPTQIPTGHPTESPTHVPTSVPTKMPTWSPTNSPTRVPTAVPTALPTSVPTKAPTAVPTGHPTRSPSLPPTRKPTIIIPQIVSTKSQTKSPTSSPTHVPTHVPTKVPTSVPTQSPTHVPTKKPTRVPTGHPTQSPTHVPTKKPTQGPTIPPTKKPTKLPSRVPTESPTAIPTATPTIPPTRKPTSLPTSAPTYSWCYLNFEMDLLFLVDTGCYLTTSQCTNVTSFLRNLTEKVYGPNVRMGFVTYDSSAHEMFSFGNMEFNSARTEILKDIDSLTCNSNVNNVKVDVIKGLNKVISMFNASNAYPHRYKKLVMVNFCNPTRLPSIICEYEREFNASKIDVEVVNVGSQISQNYYSCFTTNSYEKLFTIPTISSTALGSHLQNITDVICELPTPAPTSAPTSSPTPRAWWTAVTPKPTVWG